MNDRNHGLQFKAQVLKATAPTTAEGIERYLASGQMRGIGPAMAKRIVTAFGEATFDMIEATPERLKEVAGIGPMSGRLAAVAEEGDRDRRESGKSKRRWTKLREWVLEDASLR